MMPEVWTWTVIAIIGVVMQSILITYSCRRLRRIYVLQLENGDRRRILVSHIRSAGCYWMAHAVFLYIGLRIIIGFNFGAVAWLLIFAQLCLLYAGFADFGDLLYWRRKSDDAKDSSA
jgi:hypothetical protein